MRSRRLYKYMTVYRKPGQMLKGQHYMVTCPSLRCPLNLYIGEIWSYFQNEFFLIKFRKMKLKGINFPVKMYKRIPIYISVLGWNGKVEEEYGRIPMFI